jgi:hypothetical protein
VIFAWHNEAANAPSLRCRKIGRLAIVAIASTRTAEARMNQHAVVNKFSHVKPGDTEFTGGGLRDFFL